MGDGERVTPGGTPIVAAMRVAPEFDLVRAIAARLGDRASGLGDDAAVLALPRGDDVVLTVDASIEGVHFRREWLTPHEIGYRAAAAAVSDLAAMAATPRALLVATAFPPGWIAEVPELSAGIGELADAVGARVVGGNLSAGRELSLTITAVGTVFAPLRRTGLTAGDHLYVTGRLGGPAAALAELRDGRQPAEAFRQRFAHPVPRVAEAAWLATHGATTGIDVSDGLLADLEHLAAASQLSIEVDAARLPCLGDVPPAQAARSGEEYELIVGSHGVLDVAAFEARFDLPLTRIARVGAGPPGVTAHGLDRVAKPPGHDHFSG